MSIMDWLKSWGRPSHDFETEEERREWVNKTLADARVRLERLRQEVDVQARRPEQE